MEEVKKPTFEKYAIFQTGGKQYQAIPGKTIAVEKLEGNAGDKIDFSEVLFRKTSEGKYCKRSSLKGQHCKTDKRAKGYSFSAQKT